MENFCILKAIHFIKNCLTVFFSAFFLFHVIVRAFPVELEAQYSAFAVGFYIIYKTLKENK